MQHTPSDYRMMAAMCVEIANGMSLDTDRLRLTGRAEEWLELAQKTEAAHLPKIADGGSVQSLEAQPETDAIESGKASEDEQLPGSPQASAESRTQADVIELAQTAEAEPLAEIFDDRRAGSMHRLDLQTQIDGGTPRSQLGQSASAGERGGHRPAASRLPGAGMAWSMLCNVLLLAVLALFLTALFAWGP